MEVNIISIKSQHTRPIRYRIGTLSFSSINNKRQSILNRARHIWPIRLQDGCMQLSIKSQHARSIKNIIKENIQL